MAYRSLLVLGGSGFVGKSILEEFTSGKLKKYKFKKIILMSRNINKLKLKYKLYKNISFLSADLIKLKSLPNTDVLIHAAESSIKHKNYKAFKNNQIISKKVTENILRIIKKINTPKKIIYLSSGAIYGNNNKLKKIKEQHLKRNKIYKFNKIKKIYAINKLKSEDKFIKLKSKHDVTILRLFSFSGKYLSSRSDYIISDLIKWIKLKNILKINSSNFKYTYRSFMKSDELVKSIMESSNFKSKIKNQIFNVGSDQAINLFDLIELISKKYNLRYKILKKQTKKIDYYIPNINKFLKYSNYKYSKMDISKTFDFLKSYKS